MQRTKENEKKIAGMAKQLLLIFLLVGIFTAGCSEEAYLNACRSCPFDEKGYMDKSCYESYTQSGINCIAARYPLAAAKHASGKCPQIDACSEKLNLCIKSYDGFTDQEKCHSGMAICFREADRCVHEAAKECGEEIEVCKTAAILFSIGLMVFFSRFDSSF